MRKLKSEDLKLLEQICQLKQISLWKTMCEYLKSTYKKVKYTKDYIYAEGDIPIALVAHLDTVFSTPPQDIYYDSKKCVMWSPDGLGADDRAGVFAILKILQTGLRPHVIFTTDEEKGGVGASQLVLVEKKHPFNKLKYMIQLDRRGANDCVFYECDNKKFTKYIESFGFTENFGSFSDISILCPAWKVAGVNLSVGYEDEHTTVEILHTNLLLLTISKVVNMLNAATDASFFKFVPCKWYGKYYYSEKDKKDSKEFYDFLSGYDTYDDYMYGTYGYNLLTDDVVCDKCGKVFLEYETIPVELSNHGLIYVCPDCLSVDEVAWCYSCGEAYAIEDAESDNGLCYTCRAELEKRKQEERIKLNELRRNKTESKAST